MNAVAVAVVVALAAAASPRAAAALDACSAHDLRPAAQTHATTFAVRRAGAAARAEDTPLFVHVPHAPVVDVLAAVAAAAGVDARVLEPAAADDFVSLHFAQRPAHEVVAALFGPAYDVVPRAAAPEAPVATFGDLLVVARAPRPARVRTTIPVDDAATARQALPFVCAALLGGGDSAAVHGDDLVLHVAPNSDDVAWVLRFVRAVRAAGPATAQSPAWCVAPPARDPWDDGPWRPVVVRRIGPAAGAATRVSVQAPRARTRDVAVAVAAIAGLDLRVDAIPGDMPATIDARDARAEDVLRDLPGGFTHDDDGGRLWMHWEGHRSWTIRLLPVRDAARARSLLPSTCARLTPGRGAAALVGHALLVMEAERETLDAVQASVVDAGIFVPPAPERDDGCGPDAVRRDRVERDDAGVARLVDACAPLAPFADGELVDVPLFEDAP